MKSRFGSKTKIVHLIYTCSTPAPQKFQRTLTSLLQRGHETSQLHIGRMLCSWQSQVKDYNVTALTAKICDLCL